MISSKAKDHVRSFDDLFAAQDEHRIYLLIGEEEADALRAGTVPESVREQARMAMDTEWQMAKAATRKKAG